MGATGVVSQLIPLVALPFITRMYSPADMGSYAVWLSAASVISIVASGRYELAVILPEESPEAAGILVVSVVTLAVSSLAVAAGLLAISVLAPVVVVGLRGSLILMPVTIFMMGMFQSLNFWRTRQHRFASLGAARVTQAAVANIAALAGGLIWPSAQTLAIAWAIGSASSVLVLSPAIVQVWREANIGHHERGYWRGLAHEYRRYPLANVPHALIDGLREAGLLVALNGMFGAAATGQFSVASRLTRAPASLVGQAVSQVYYRRASELERRKGDLRKDVLRGAGVTLGLMLVPSVLLAATAWWLMPALLGSQWQDAGRYTSVLVPALLSMLVVAPFSFVPHIKGRLSGALGFAVVDLGLKAVALAIGWLEHSTMLAVGLVSAEMTIVHFALLIWYLRICELPAVPSIENPA